MYQVMPAAISLPLFWPKKGSTFKQQIYGTIFFLELYQPSLPNKKSQFCRELLFHSQGSQNTYSMLCMYSYIKVPEHTSRRGVCRHTWPSQTWPTLGRSQSLDTRQQRPGARWSLKSTAVSYRMLCCSYTILYPNTYNLHTYNYTCILILIL